MKVKDKYEYEEEEQGFTFTASFTTEVMDIDLESAKAWFENYLATESRHIDFDIEEVQMKIFKITYEDDIEAESFEEAKEILLTHLNFDIKYDDVSAFGIEEHNLEGDRRCYK